MRTALKVLLLFAVLATTYGLGMRTGPSLARYFTRDTTNLTKLQPQPRHVVFGLGRLEPGKGNIPVLGPPRDRVEKLFVELNDHVKEGKELLQLASRTDREKEVELAQKQIDEANAQLKAIDAAEKARLEEVKRQAEAARQSLAAEEETQDIKRRLLRRQLESARSRQERVASLNRSIVRVPADETERLALSVRQAQSELDAAEAAREAPAERGKSQERTAEAQRAAVRAESDLSRQRIPLESLKQSLVLAQRRLEQTVIRAPVSGVVVRLNVNVGDPTTTEPLLDLAAGKDMKAIAEVDANDIGVLDGWAKQGRVPVKITHPALPKNGLTGWVESAAAIGSIVSRNTVPTLSPRADVDRRVIPVRVEIKGDATIARQFIGLQVDVEFALPPR